MHFFPITFLLANFDVVFLDCIDINRRCLNAYSQMLYNDVFLSSINCVLFEFAIGLGNNGVQNTLV